MKQTEHCELNQWELSDPIRMADFNADNAKIAAELARLRANVADLAYYIGQFGLIHFLNNQRYTSLHAVSSFLFQNPSDYGPTGSAVIQDNRVKLTGKGATGSVTVNGYLYEPLPMYKEVRLWFHHKGGSVTPLYNGVPMEKADTSGPWDYSPIGGRCTAAVYTAPLPASQSAVITLEMNCGNDASMELYDLFLARM